MTTPGTNLESFINALTLRPMSENFNLDKKKYNFNSFDESILLNTNNFFILEYDKLKEFASNLFEYDNLPKEIPSKFIEKSLFEEDLVFFKADDDKYIASTYTSDKSNLSHYGDLTSVTLKSQSTSLQGKVINVSNDLDDLDDTKGVIIKNSYDGLHPSFKSLSTATMLAKINQSIYVNLNNISVPLVASVDAKNKKSAEEMFSKIKMGEPIIFSLKTSTGGTVKDLLQQMNMNVTYHGDSLMGLYNDRINEYLTYIGVNNANIAKRERNTVDEVNSNNQAISLMAQSKLTTRKESFEIINKRFNLDVNVSFNTDTFAYASELMMSKGNTDTVKVKKEDTDE